MSFSVVLWGLDSMSVVVTGTDLLTSSSQAVDVGTLKSIQADTVRILVWVLSFMGFGYATGEFEVTSERLGVYRPEEHIEYVFLILHDSHALLYSCTLCNTLG